MGQLQLAVAFAYSNDIKPNSMVPVLLHYVMFGCCMHQCLLLGCHKRLWMAKLVTTPGLYLDKEQELILLRNDINLCTFVPIVTY